MTHRSVLRPYFDCEAGLNGQGFQSAGGKQLLSEAIGVLGSLLLALDRRLQSPMRERLVVAYYRLRGGSQAVGPSANAVIALCASTGLDSSKRRSPPGAKCDWLTRQFCFCKDVTFLV